MYVGVCLLARGFPTGERQQPGFGKCGENDGGKRRRLELRYCS